MFRNFGNSSHWFMRLDDDVYLQVPKLKAFLHANEFSDRKSYYIGRAASGNAKKRHLYKLAPNQMYCGGGAGVLMNNLLVLLK